MEEIAEVKVKIEHDAKLFNQVCLNIKGDLTDLDTCIKYLRKFISKGKRIYLGSARAYRHTSKILQVFSSIGKCQALLALCWQ